MSDKEGVPCTFVVSLSAVDNRKDSHLVGKPGELLFTHEGPIAGPPFWQHILRETYCHVPSVIPAQSEAKHSIV